MSFDKTKAMRNAERYLAQGKIRSAIGEYEQVIKHDSRDYGTINALGDLYCRNTDISSAIKCYSAVAEHYSTQGFAQKAIAVYNKIHRLEPDSIEIRRKLGELYKQKGSINEARSHFQKVAEDLERSGRRLDALAVRKEIASLDPTNVDGYLTLAEAYIAEGLASEAVESLNVAAERLATRGQHDKAVENFEKALSLISSDARALAGYVRSQNAAGNSTTAARRLTELLEDSPHDREIRSLLVECHLKAADLTEAEKAVIKLVELEPAHYPRLLDVAKAYLETGDAAGAARILTMSSEHMLMGGQAEEFSQIVSAVLERDPEQAEALRLQARCCSWQRDEDAMCAALDKLADVAFRSGSVEDERYALVQLSMLVPQERRYAARLNEINEQYGFESQDLSESLFDSHFLRGSEETSSQQHDVPDHSALIVQQVESVSGDDGEPAPASFDDESEETSFAIAPNVLDERGTEAEEESPAQMDEDPDTARLFREIDSIRFYLENGYLELAEKAAVELKEEFGDRDEVVELLDEIRMRESGQAAVQQSVYEMPAAPAPENDGRNIGLEDLRNELGLDEVQLDEGADFETSFNTATAYKEMGLTEQAIKEFQQAAAICSPSDGTRRFFSCANLLGLCFMEQGMPHLASKWFVRALETGDLTSEEKQGIWYELAAAYEASGDVTAASTYFEHVYAENASFRDVSERIKALTVTL
jgi:tetratricopeptide (TPR) repeat protein